MSDFQPPPIIEYVVAFIRTVDVSPNVEIVESTLQLTFGLRVDDLAEARRLVAMIAYSDFAGWDVLEVVPKSHIMPLEGFE